MPAGAELAEYVDSLLVDLDSEIDLDGRLAADTVRVGLAATVAEQLDPAALALHRGCNRARGEAHALRACGPKLSPPDRELRCARLMFTVDALWIASAAPGDVFHVGEKVLTKAGRVQLLVAQRHAFAQRHRATPRWRLPRERGEHGRRRPRPRRTRGPPADDEHPDDPDHHLGRRRRRWAR